MKTRIALTLVLLFASAVFACAQTSIAGKWESENTPDKWIFDLKVDGSVLTGTVATGESSFPIENGKIIDSNTISLSWTTAFPPAGNPVSRSATGTLSGDELKLAIKGKIESTGQEFSESMTLKRSK